MTPLDIYVESKDGKNLNFMTFTSHRPPAKSTWETAEGCPDLAWTTFELAVVLQWNDFQVSVDDNLVFTLKIPELKTSERCHSGRRRLSRENLHRLIHLKIPRS
ncbi:uncharacterized protein LOC124276253 [Haliotis rubra]|uniref:uncharacterized protein LOC124276253 n=1 Tax=Haliotis rubra TaxID=36100 RepID=UPI001EE5EF7C|nr:uncharacterized protein LOC124276253 [Haliotis rubra]